MPPANDRARDPDLYDVDGVAREPFEGSELMQRLAARRSAVDRYTPLGEIGRGGMGRVLRVRDEDLHRDLAMKVLRDESKPPPDAREVSPKMMLSARFLEEAQVAAQLDHPGIVPVHDVGLDAHGRMYFTMKLVRGRTLEKVLAQVRDGTDGWSTTRLLGVLVRVCEAMGYAHERGVLHRDLKPSNIMIGHHGEVFVMDWGLARLIARQHHEHVDESETGELYSPRQSGSGSSLSSPFVTEDGRILGTPAYMSPEQARGDGGALGPPSDVYAIGAIMYQALTGRAPYSPPGKHAENRVVWLALQKGPPPSVESFAPHTPAELVAICEKAMARTLTDRYASMAELGEDLRAYLELRAVNAHRTGPITELRKWISRNRLAATMTAALIVVITGAGFLIAWRESLHARGAKLRAEAHQAAALRSEASSAWPIDARSMPELDFWLTRARAVLADSPERRRSLEELERRSIDANRARREKAPVDEQLDARISDSRAKLTLMQGEVKRLQSLPVGPDTDPRQAEIVRSGLSVFPAEIEWWKDHFASLERSKRPEERLVLFDRLAQEDCAALAELVEDQRMLASFDVPRMERDLVAAGALADRTITPERDSWARAAASIADTAQCPAYKGLELAPQSGLVPLRRDPTSGLWEFWHVLSGERPELDTNGAWKIGDRTGIVLVLIPGGEFQAGAQAQDEHGERYDVNANIGERLREVRLDPYFFGKYELTQGQWLAIQDDIPSQWFPGTVVGLDPRVTRANPVERVSWIAAAAGLRRIGLALPTEVQWERAARGGTELRFAWSDSFAEIRPRVNLFTTPNTQDLAERRARGEDGFIVHSDVGALAANGFGLYGVLGNVSEWCADWFADGCDNDAPARDGDGLIDPPVKMGKVARGASHRTNLEKQVRITSRSMYAPTEMTDVVGIRAARPVEH